MDWLPHVVELRVDRGIGLAPYAGWTGRRRVCDVHGQKEEVDGAANILDVEVDCLLITSHFTASRLRLQGQARNQGLQGPSHVGTNLEVAR
jgi:hypothetical protein